MKKLLLTLFIFTLTLSRTFAQFPDITSWIINTTITGYGGILADCQLVQFDSNNVYVSCTDVPDYSIGPWPGDPNTPSNQGFVYKFTRNPVQNTSTPVVVGLGHVGVLINGVSVFNSQDANSYNNLGYWHQNGYYFEGSSFDACNGHPAPGGEYHNHVDPKCLYNDADSTHHSPIIGFAFDGFPIYGPYGYSNPNGTGGIRRMTTSYQKRTNMVNRDTLPNGTILSPADYGPAVSVTYPLGDYVEDYKYIAGSGDLDTNNGRFCVTPEYPAGTYAYFTTIDSKLNPEYPYFVGLTYYGTVQTGNTGPGSGHNTVPGGTKTYTPPAGIAEVNNTFKITAEPNPVINFARISLMGNDEGAIKVTLYNSLGQPLQTYANWQMGSTYSVDMTKYPQGMYFLRISSDKSEAIQKLIKVQ